MNYLEETFDSEIQADQGIIVLVLFSNSVWYGWSLRIHAQDAKSSEQAKMTCTDQGLKDGLEVWWLDMVSNATFTTS